MTDSIILGNLERPLLVTGITCSVFIKEFLFQGESYMHLYVAGKVCSALIKKVFLFQR